MELPEFLTIKVIAIIVVAVVGGGIGTVFFVLPMLAPEPVITPEEIKEVEPIEELNATVTPPELPDNVTDAIDVITDDVNDTLSDITDAIPEIIIPEIINLPEPIKIEIIEDPIPIEIQEIPDTIPEPPDDIPEIPEKTIQDKVDRFNTATGTPVPEKGTTAGSIDRVISGNEIVINGVEIKISGVSATSDDGEDSDQWRQALMRLCPTSSLALYKGGTVWCYGYPANPPLASVNEVMTEADYDIIGRGCHVAHDDRLLGCSH